MMRSFGLIALLIVLLIVAWLSTRQVAFVQGPLAPHGAASAPANVREQSEQIQQQFKQQLDKAMQTPRDIPDEAK